MSRAAKASSAPATSTEKPGSFAEVAKAIADGFDDHDFTHDQILTFQRVGREHARRAAGFGDPETANIVTTGDDVAFDLLACLESEDESGESDPADTLFSQANLHLNIALRLIKGMRKAHATGAHVDAFDLGYAVDMAELASSFLRLGLTIHGRQVTALAVETKLAKMSKPEAEKAVTQ